MPGSDAPFHVVHRPPAPDAAPDRGRGDGRRLWYRLGSLSLLCALATACSASFAQGSGADRLIAAARPGQTIVLPEGTTGVLTIARRTFSPAITIDASHVVLSGIALNGVDGVNVVGGAIVGPGGRSRGISIRESRNITVRNMTVSGAYRGIVVQESQDVELTELNLTGLISDGINIALSQRVLVARNRCRDFQPSLAVYAADGSRVRDGDHPDCIQAWSRPTHPATADVSVIGNDIDLNGQGIFFGNHARDGVDDGGFDRIIIRDNRVRVSFPHGITLVAARGATVTGNLISTVPGSVMRRFPNGPIRATLRLSGTGIVACDNQVIPPTPLPGVPTRQFVGAVPGTEPC